MGALRGRKRWVGSDVNGGTIRVPSGFTNESNDNCDDWDGDIGANSGPSTSVHLFILLTLRLIRKIYMKAKITATTTAPPTAPPIITDMGTVGSALAWATAVGWDAEDGAGTGLGPKVGPPSTGRSAAELFDSEEASAARSESANIPARAACGARVVVQAFRGAGIAARWWWWCRDRRRAPLATCACIAIGMAAFWHEFKFPLPLPVAASTTSGESERGKVNPTIACGGAGGDSEVVFDW
jgi:hypothetical protein